MALGARATLVWGTAAAAVASALLLTSNGGGLPRFSADVRPVRGEPVAPRPVLPKRERPAPAPPAADRSTALPLTGTR